MDLAFDLSPMTDKSTGIRIISLLNRDQKREQ
jgi:hypothetical protein